MKTSVIVSIILLILTNYAFAREKQPLRKKEKMLAEIVGSGGYAYGRDDKGNEYFCFGDINRMSLYGNVNCTKVKGVN